MIWAELPDLRRATRQDAEAALLAARGDVITDDEISSMVTEELLLEVVEEAWRGQFDGDRSSAFKRLVNQIVDDAAEKAVLGVGGDDEASID